MGDSGVGDEMAMVGGKMDDNESERERVFTVGEVVEFWKVCLFVAIDKHQASLLLLRGWMEMDYML